MLYIGTGEFKPLYQYIMGPKMGAMKILPVKMTDSFCTIFTNDENHKNTYYKFYFIFLLAKSLIFSLFFFCFMRKILSLLTWRHLSFNEWSSRFSNNFYFRWINCQNSVTWKKWLIITLTHRLINTWLIGRSWKLRELTKKL